MYIWHERAPSCYVNEQIHHFSLCLGQRLVPLVQLQLNDSSRTKNLSSGNLVGRYFERWWPDAHLVDCTAQSPSTFAFSTFPNTHCSEWFTASSACDLTLRFELSVQLISDLENDGLLFKSMNQDHREITYFHGHSSEADGCDPVRYMIQPKVAKQGTITTVLNSEAHVRLGAYNVRESAAFISVTIYSVCQIQLSPGH